MSCGKGLRRRPAPPLNTYMAGVMNADVTEGTAPAPEDAEPSHAIRAQLDSTNPDFAANPPAVKVRMTPRTVSPRGVPPLVSPSQASTRQSPTAVLASWAHARPCPTYTDIGLALCPVLSNSERRQHQHQELYGLRTDSQDSSVAPPLRDSAPPLGAQCQARAEPHQNVPFLQVLLTPYCGTALKHVH